MMSRMMIAMASSVATIVVFFFVVVSTADEGFVSGGCEEWATCPCPKNMDPVCDAQGKVYSNHCIFDCVKRRCTGKKKAI